MSDTSLERPRRRWQFSLRKLLLWTAVVAVWLSGFATLFAYTDNSNERISPDEKLVLTLIVVFIAFPYACLRAIVGPTLVLPAIFAVQGILGLILATTGTAHNLPTEFGVFLFLLSVVAGAVDLSYRVVNWADTFIENMTTHRE